MISSDDFIKSKIKALEQDLSLCREKIARLRFARGYENDESTLFKLDKQILKAEQTCDDLFGSMQKYNSLRLYGALQNLDYFEQVNAFRSFTERHRSGAFLIHGGEGYGQQWLLKLLLQTIEHATTNLLIEFQANTRSRGLDYKFAWERLAKNVGLNLAAEGQVIQRLNDKLSARDVTLVFHSVGELSKAALEQILENFWVPLATGIQVDPHKEPHYLLMFLVDYYGSTGDWDLKCAEKYDPEWVPQTLVKLPRLSSISYDDLKYWIRAQGRILPYAFIEQAEQMADTIWVQSNDGGPEQIFELICMHCGYNWYEGAEWWLKL
ncbi:MAG: hypothetical protein BroJett039_06560 [Chloroflexota bacterium]|nr:MAG: hypothetical protein BroJett039_06560 [Chloroflexota bacterium]